MFDEMTSQMGSKLSYFKIGKSIYYFKTSQWWKYYSCSEIYSINKKIGYAHLALWSPQIWDLYSNELSEQFGSYMDSYNKEKTSISVAVNRFIVLTLLPQQ